MAKRIIGTTPKQDGYRMPAEFEPQQGVWMLWPERNDNWRDGGKPAQKAFADVAKAIAKFEKVTVGASVRQYQNARAKLPENIRVVELESDDAWVRDCGPTFLVNDKGGLRAVDWEFNAWGGLVDGLYFPWDKDDQIARKICEIADVDSYRTEGFVLEGGSIHVDAFGSHDDADHVYNTPRGWYMLRYFNPNTFAWDGPDADFTPRSDDLPWCMVPEKKITPEDVKYVLSSHYQGTPYDPYAATASERGIYRPIGVNRNDFMALLQMRPDVPEDFRAVEWLAFASNAFNTMVPFYANVDTTPEYLSNTTGDVSTDNFYWASRLLAAMADASYAKSVFHIERYTLSVGSKANGIINTYDDAQRGEADPAARAALRTKANEELAAMVRAETTDALNKVLFELSSGMKNAYSRSDA